jgi:hypothetical protein
MLPFFQTFPLPDSRHHGTVYFLLGRKRGDAKLLQEGTKEEKERDVEDERRRREVSSSKDAITSTYVFPPHSPINK